MTNDPTPPQLQVTVHRDDSDVTWHATIPPNTTETDRLEMSAALSEAADAIAGEPTPEDRVSAACCSAMRMIRLLTLNAPSGILHAEIRNLTRLVNEACPSDAEQE